jgi:hypothetical protein
MAAAPAPGLAPAGSWSLAAYGLPYGLTAGPYGMALALTWDRAGSGAARVVVLESTPGALRCMRRTWAERGSVQQRKCQLCSAVCPRGSSFPVFCTSQLQSGH